MRMFWLTDFSGTAVSSDSRALASGACNPEGGRPPPARPPRRGPRPLGTTPTGRSVVSLVSLPTLGQSRVQTGRTTPALCGPPAPALRPWPHWDPAPYRLRSVAVAAASSCVPSLLWLVMRAGQG